jgi:hypothetical protein
MLQPTISNTHLRSQAGSYTRQPLSGRTLPSLLHLRRPPLHRGAGPPSHVPNWAAPSAHRSLSPAARSSLPSSPYPPSPPARPPPTIPPWPKHVLTAHALSSSPRTTFHSSASAPCGRSGSTPSNPPGPPTRIRQDSCRASRFACRIASLLHSGCPAPLPPPPSPPPSRALPFSYHLLPPPQDYHRVPSALYAWNPPGSPTDGSPYGPCFTRAVGPRNQPGQSARNSDARLPLPGHAPGVS